MIIQFPRKCGTCKTFQQCWEASGQILKTLSIPPEDDYENSKQAPACPQYQDSERE
jgi:hypothetical protein